MVVTNALRDTSLPHLSAMHQTRLGHGGPDVCRLRQMYVYHGQDRDMRPSFLAEQDIVVTTYSTLAADFKSRKGLLEARDHPLARSEATEC